MADRKTRPALAIKEAERALPLGHSLGGSISVGALAACNFFDAGVISKSYQSALMVVIL